jgi:putative thioredoxin
MTDTVEAPKPTNWSEETWLTAMHLSNSLPNESVYVAWTAPWCGPCKILKPVLERVAKEKSKHLYLVNVDEIKGMAVAFGVRGVPTVMELRDGMPTTRRMVGAQTEAAVREFLQ